MGTPEKPIPNLDTVLQTLYQSSVRRKDLITDQSLEYVKFQLAEAIGGRTIPYHLNNLLQLDKAHWATISRGGLPLLFVSGQEGADTVSVQNADKTICVVPSANPQANRDIAHTVKFAGIIEQPNSKRIVAASYSPYNGQLFNLLISAAEEEVYNPVAGLTPPYNGDHIDEETRFAFRAYNQTVWNKHYMLTNPTQQAGVITEAMYEQVDHSHFFHIFNPRRIDQTDELFHITENNYTRTLGMIVEDNPSENIVTIGQFMEEWQIQISSYLPETDITLPFVDSSFDPPEVPPITDVWNAWDDWRKN